MIVTIILVFILFSFVSSFNDTSICIDYVSYSTQINITEHESYLESKRVWCLKIPPRCTKQETKYRTITKLRTIPKIRELQKCCPGYRFNTSSIPKKCIPECSKACVNGKCILPEKCECHKGFTGETCDIVKEPLKCGQCQNNSICDPDLGICKCSSGWVGKECNIPCEKGYFGINCNKTCLQDVCDHVTGKSKCRDGYTGAQCKYLCPAQTYGENCSQTCTCKNDALCNHVSGKCHCLPGWTGIYCNIHCPLGKYGSDCLQNCLCKNDAMCSPINGECRCTRGWTGKFCTSKCIYGYYGEHCATPCKCKSESFICDHLEGCICPNNFTGELCDVSIFDKYDPQYETITNLSENNDSVILVISLSIIIMIIIIILIIVGIGFYKRKRRINEVHNVYYNPNNKLNNRIVNDLHVSTTFSTEKDNSLDNPEFVEARSSNLQENVPEYCTPLIKNFKADLNNPNINKMETNKSENISSISEETEMEIEYKNTAHLKNSMKTKE